MVLLRAVGAEVVDARVTNREANAAPHARVVVMDRDQAAAVCALADDEVAVFAASVFEDVAEVCHWLLSWSLVQRS